MSVTDAPRWHLIIRGEELRLGLLTPQRVSAVEREGWRSIESWRSKPSKLAWQQAAYVDGWARQ